jgi:hypothetical protein
MRFLVQVKLWLGKVAENHAAVLCVLGLRTCKQCRDEARLEND